MSKQQDVTVKILQIYVRESWDALRRVVASFVCHFHVGEILNDQHQYAQEEQREKLERGGTAGGNGCYRLVTNTDAK